MLKHPQINPHGKELLLPERKPTPRHHHLLHSLLMEELALRQRLGLWRFVMITRPCGHNRKSLTRHAPHRPLPDEKDPLRAKWSPCPMFLGPAKGVDELVFHLALFIKK